ncbi:Phage-related baseplate assembly protein [Cohaesibacter sp. ES.047]|uniref:baseplate J/gp47 family protein n=1 Tax=Cohaesibacter sp. ES.047 TaxID=1798205 RepID=UPI000BB8197A|nr:baseplate J/gp47 family protein [Cohaesibacter sp. ES.047]SNY93424.1 Phage-related baseplate assembly protein [Cohaesibacter sp. ES.047]
MAFYAPTVIDLSNVPGPAVLEALSFEDLFDGYRDRFLEIWAEEQATDESLPDYDVDLLETDPAKIVGRAFSYLRLLDRSRVNDAIKALLAPYSTGTDLDNLVASRNISRLIVSEASATSDVVMETDLNLLRRYLLSFDVPASGSAGRYLFDAWTAWPSMGDARVNGQLVHGRRGDTDVVICGLDGALPTDAERDQVAAAVRHAYRMPEAASVAVLKATQQAYDVDLKIVVPGVGPDPEVVVGEVFDRVRKAALARALIGGQIPTGLLAGAAYGSNVLTVLDNAPVVIASSPYLVPVLGSITIKYEVAE